MEYFSDKTYCPYYLLCIDGPKCDSKLDSAVQDEAANKNKCFWYYTSKPKCFKNKNEVKSNGYK